MVPFCKRFYYNIRPELRGPISPITVSLFPLCSYFSSYHCWLWLCEFADIGHTHTQFLHNPAAHQNILHLLYSLLAISSVLLVPWTTFCPFIINALLTSTSPQRAVWPFILVSMGMTQIPDLFVPRGLVLLSWTRALLPLHASTGTRTH